MSDSEIESLSDESIDDEPIEEVIEKPKKVKADHKKKI
jgi:hypothetical protein